MTLATPTLDRHIEITPGVCGGKGYKVEFVALDGETITVTTLLTPQVRPIEHREIAHARLVAVH